MYTHKKSLGQHFLHDQAIIAQILDSVNQDGVQRLLEIGPGAGALTEYIGKWPDIDFKAIEIDDEKVQYLLKTMPALEGRILHQDILDAPPPFGANFSIVGNFPYNISSPILFKVYDWEPMVDEVVGMFQKEVAQRIAAKHGSKTYGILSVLMQAFFKVEYLFDVDEKCFTPPPKVMSGVIRLSNERNPFQIDDKKAFKRLVKAAFGQRRKTLRNSLKSYYAPELLQDEVFNKRAEQLSVADFVHLYQNVLVS